MIDPVLRVQSRLTGRDLTLLGWLADHGVLTSFQIAHALYPSSNFAQRRLRTLTKVGLVDRFRPQRPDGGSHPYHYVLGQLGADVISAQRGEPIPRRNHARQRRWHLTNRANLPHLLGVNGFFTDLAGHARTHPDAHLSRWWPASRCQQIGAFASPDDDVHVKAYAPRVRPDGHGIWTENTTIIPFFLEYDTGTEPLHVLTAKLAGYNDLARTTSRVWPVLFWLHATARELHLHEQMAAEGIRYPVATAARDNPAQAGASPADAVWWLHRYTGGPLRLAKLATDSRSRPT